jgi:hypothetical protein
MHKEKFWLIGLVKVSQTVFILLQTGRSRMKSLAQDLDPK